MGRAFDVIAFDGDDTLWHNERSYREGRRRFQQVLAAAGVTLGDDEIEDRVGRTEHANLQYFGYGVSSFTLSLIEAAIELTDGRVAGRDLGTVIDIARQMLSEQIELFDSVTETLAQLASRYPLMLVTKGDLLHQTSKLQRSGLQRYFHHVEVVSHKTPEVYAGILDRRGIEPGRFLMVGNSLKSDVLPVVEAGGWAVHIPAALTWSPEHATPPAHARSRFFELASLAGLAELLTALEQNDGRADPDRPTAAGRAAPADS